VEIAIAEQRDSEESAIAALIRCREALAKLNVSKRSLDARWGALGGPEQALSTYSAMATPTLSRLAQPRAVLPRFTPEEPSSWRRGPTRTAKSSCSGPHSATLRNRRPRWRLETIVPAWLQRRPPPRTASMSSTRN
ncbi:MAG: hypothetical protein LC749_02855, partial [Actinobacteria bacterium]|nr:hypothetical protein [Actinomycetota bacterium]